MGIICQQRQYKQIQSDNQKSKKNPKKPIAFYNFEQKKYDTFKFPKNTNEDLQIDKFIQNQQKAKVKQNLLFQEYLKKQEQKKRLEDLKFSQHLNSLTAIKKKKPFQTDMATVLYSYMRHYGHNPKSPQILKFIEQNYNPGYCSYCYKLNNLTPITTYKGQVVDRLTVAHQNSMISDHQTFFQADQKNRRITYSWTIRNQLTNHRTLYNCEAIFDEQNRFLKITLKQTDHFTFKPSPKEPQPEKKFIQAKPTNYAYIQPTDWGAHYARQVQNSNDQFRQNMNRQAQQWNDYARQRNARGY